MARSSSGKSGPNPYARPDALTKKAKAEGYPARSIYKLEEIDRRCGLLRPGMKVLDLGCAPGSWLLYIAQKIGPRGHAIGIDLTPLAIALPANVESLTGDAFAREGEAFERIAALAPFDVIVSDMAPNTSGTRLQDQMRSAELVERSLEAARDWLTPGGAWVAKLFMSNELVRVRTIVRGMFTEERILRPEGTRSVSVEVFMVGMGRKTEKK